MTHRLSAIPLPPRSRRSWCCRLSSLPSQRSHRCRHSPATPTSHVLRGCSARSLHRQRIERGFGGGFVPAHPRRGTAADGERPLAPAVAGGGFAFVQGQCVTSHPADDRRHRRSRHQPARRVGARWTLGGGSFHLIGPSAEHAAQLFPLRRASWPLQHEHGGRWARHQRRWPQRRRRRRPQWRRIWAHRAEGKLWEFTWGLAWYGRASVI